ncbi:MAG: DUF1800 domain-containing protein [Sinimarinibacterium flocculans]|uniref:DUF1800 domain-containing protein n=1 Tax=Sinimarinibacterium flocculans TaxID=985250 RepID=UPI003C4D686F
MDRREFLRACALVYSGGALSSLTGCGSSAPVSLPGVDPVAGDPLDPTTAADPLPHPDPLVHLLKRTRFGVSAEDLEAARAQGAEAYLDAQLAPQLLPDIAELLAAVNFPLTQLPTPLVSTLSNSELLPASQQLAEKTVFLASYSDRQLFEVMVDFWNDHFNVENVTGTLPGAKIAFDRDVVRVHALGRFGALLHATAKSAAMLEYLDGRSNRAQGPNENYSRELMELHTLGHGGGYTETDVREVARCFTGWNSDQTTYAFQFNANQHDSDSKTVLGHSIAAGGGVEDGERVLDILAEHPSTARHLATRLARRFVSDDPPTAVIDAVATEYTRTDGDIPSMLRVLMRHTDFQAAADRKLRRPLDFVCGAIRAFDADPSHYPGAGLIDLLSRLGQVPHRWFPPDGYPDRGDYWLSTSGLMERWNFAATLVESRGLLGQSQASDHVGSSETPASLVDTLSARLLMRPLRARDREALIAVAGDGAAALSGEALVLASERIAGLLLASPAFNLR